jgi:hypothetical protein
MERVRAVGAQKFRDTTARVPPSLKSPGRDAFGKIDVETLFHFETAEG